MRNINKVILIGNVAKVPDTKEISGGQKMTTFTIATNRSWNNGSNQKQHQAEFHNLVAWGKIAEICDRFLHKGALVYIEGYLKTRSWEVENGNRLFKTEVVVQDVLVLERGNRGGNNQNGETPRRGVSTEEDFFEGEDLFVDNEKSVTEIEKTLNDKLAAGNDVVADTNIDDDTFSIDKPLFDEEKT